MIALVVGLVLGMIIALVRAAFKSRVRQMRTLRPGVAVAPVVPEYLSRQGGVLLSEAQVRPAKG